MKTLRLAVLLSMFALFSLLALLTPGTDLFRSYSAPAPPAVAASIQYPVTVADGVQFRVIYPDQDGHATVAAKVGTTLYQMGFDIDLDQCGWFGTDGTGMSYNATTGWWVGQLLRSDKPNVRCMGRLTVCYSQNPEDCFHYDVPFSTEIGVFTALHSPYVMPDNLLQAYMAITTTEGTRWEFSAEYNQPLRLYVDDDFYPEDVLMDTGVDGDLRANDGVFTGWTPVTWSGAQMATFNIWDWPVAQIPFTVTTEPELIVLTDLTALHAEFLDTGTDPEEDRDGSMWLDFYELLDRLYVYANRHRGIVYDLGREITIDHGYPLDYPGLVYDNADKQTNRFRMGKEIDAMLARLSEETEDSFDYIAIIGDDEVVPFYRRSDPLGQEIGYGDKAGTGCAARVDSGGNFILTDLPYSMRADDDPETVPNPVPEVALGRIFADHPDQLITIIDAYDTPLRFVPGQARAALFPIKYDGIAWPWFIEHLFIPILEQHGLKTGNIQAVPPYATGKFYYWNPDLIDWRPVTVTHAISDTTLTVIYSHADHTGNQTPLGVGCDMERALCDEHYDPMPLADQHVYVNAGCHGGYSVAHHSAAAKFDDYEPAIVSSLMEKHVAYLGNTVYGRGVNYANEWDDYLWTGFVNQLFNVGTPTVGAAWLRAWPGYWHTLSAASTSATTQAYGKAFYGLPTQPIKHTSVTAAVSAVDGAAVAGTASIRRLSLPIDIAEFEIVETGDGALVRPGNGGGVLGVLDKPLVPQVIQRFSLPLNTTWVTITENLAARTTEDLGPIPLAVGTTGLRCVDAEPASRSVAATLEEPFPAKSWSAEFSYLPDALEVVLRVIPAQVAPDGALTVFHHMQFDLDVVLPALSPEITALSVNNGQSVQAGQGKVAAQITVSSDRQLPLEVSCEVWEPGGALIGSAISPVTFDPGTHQVSVDLDGAGWAPGPKLVTMSIADGETGLVYDARSQQVMVNGVQVALKVDQPGVAPGQILSLRVEARNESGALVAGLSEETTLRVDDIPVNVDVTEDRTGVYVADLPTTAIASGIHIVEVQVTYAQGFMASDIAQFGVGSQWVQQLFVPALTKGG